MEKKNTKENNTLPLIIIGIVLLVVIGGSWWLYSSSKAPAANKANTNSQRTNSSAPQQQGTPVTTREQGAQPPHFKGAQNAPVVIEEFADFQCGTCAAVHPLMNEITSTYGSRIKFVFRQFPLTQIHKNAYDAAVASEAAGLQGKFWDMQNILFQNQQNWSNDANARALFADYAGRIGLDVEKFKADMSGMETKQRVDKDLQRGRSMNISGTPSLFINGRPIPFEQLNENGLRLIIDSELARVTGGQDSTAPQTAKPQSSPTAANNSAEPKNASANTANK